MERRQKKKEPGRNTEAWMMTFMDLLTLLLTFFVLVFSMCSLEAGKIRNLQDSLRAVMGVLELGKRSDFNIGFPIVTSDLVDLDETIAEELGELQNELESLSNQENIEIKTTSRGIVITMADKILFGVGAAGVNPEAFPLLEEIMYIIEESALLKVQVEGHTDNLPIKTERFPSNWELSIARAVNVVKHFVENGDIAPGRLSAAGYGESRPLVPNLTEKQRAKNRRVEILLLTKEIKKQDNSLQGRIPEK